MCAGKERAPSVSNAIATRLKPRLILRLSLNSLLDQASDLELSAKPVPATLVNNLRNQHAELAKQQRILAQQQRDRTALEGELADAVARYRALKQARADAANGTAAVPPDVAPGMPNG